MTSVETVPSGSRFLNRSNMGGGYLCARPSTSYTVAAFCPLCMRLLGPLVPSGSMSDRAAGRAGARDGDAGQFNAVIAGAIHISCYITAANRAAPVFEVVPQRNAVRCVTKPLRDGGAAGAGSLNATSASRASDSTGLAGPVPSVSSASSSSPSSLQSTPGSSSSQASHSAEWAFHAVFRPHPSSLSLLSSHAADFYREVSQPALRNACQGVNTNIVAWGVHPTQKFRLLFGKSTGNLPLSPSSGRSYAPSASSSASLPIAQPSGTASLSERDAMELYGQLGALLHEFFTRIAAPDVRQTSAVQSADEWRLGISSWLVVNNQVVDLLKPPSSSPSSSPSSHSSAPRAAPSSSPSGNANAPMAFVNLEARSLRGACSILQMAKTNRIVTKQNVEHAHFFVRVALFHRGQVSTLHLVDLVDFRDFEDPAAADEKWELLEILQELRQPPLSARQAAGSKQQKPREGASSSSPPPSPTTDSKTAGPRTPPRSSSPVASSTRRYATTLANFVLPLLTANAQTFLYANVIDLRSSLRESVALLNAVANLRGFVCPCRRLSGVAFVQLGFQAPPTDMDKEDAHADAATTASFETQAAVSIGESLLSQLAAPSPVVDGTNSPFASKWSSPPAPATSRQRNESTRPAATTDDSETADSSEAMRWLDAFQQRKREILGARVDTVAPAAEVVSLANSRVEAARSRVDASPDRAQQSPPPNSVSEIYEQLRRSMLAIEMGGDSHAATASHTADAFGASNPRHDASPPLAREMPFTMLSTSDHRELETHERYGVDFNALAAVSPVRLPSQRSSSSSRSSSRSEEGCYSSNQQQVSSRSVPVKACEGVQPPCSSEETKWDRIVSPNCTEWGRPTPSSPPEHQQGRHLRPSSPPISPPQAPQQASTPSSRHLPPATPTRLLPIADFEAQCVRAGVPSTPAAAPNVDGLDPATADRVQAADAALLRKNYDALLTIVREQQELREEAEARAADAVHDQEELRAAFEVQIENMKLDNVALRRKMRLLEKRSDAQDALDSTTTTCRRCRSRCTSSRSATWR